MSEQTPETVQAPQTSPAPVQSTVPAGVKQPEDYKRPNHDPSEKFIFETRDAGTFTVPYLENVKRGVMKRVGMRAQAFQRGDAQEDDLNPDDLMFSLIMSPEDYARLDDMTQGEYELFTEQWNELSSTKLGES